MHTFSKDPLGGVPAKRAFDILVSAILLALLSPLLALVTFLIWLQDGESPLFWQERVGEFGARFWMPKFRTMVPRADALKADLLEKADHQGSITFKMKADPRITPLGRILRKLSIDELPQLVSVLTGDMTLVGPRPATPNEVARYVGRQRGRVMARPGLTCLWQVSGRSDLPFPQQVELDLAYLAERSLGLDFWLLARTVPAVLSGRGAY